MASNPLRKPPPAPHFDDTPAALFQNAQDIIKHYNDAKAGIEQIIAEVDLKSVTFEEYVLPAIYIENELRQQIYPLIGLRLTSPNPELRKMSQRVYEMWQTMKLIDVSKLIRAISPNTSSLDPELKRYLSGKRPKPLSYNHRRAEIIERLRMIKECFQENLRTHRAGVWLPAAQFTDLSEDITSNLKKGEGSKEGLFYVKLNSPTYLAIMRCANSGDLRRELYILQQNMGNNNVPLVKEAIMLRHELAVLRDHNNFFEMQNRGAILEIPEIIQLLNISQEKLAGNLALLRDAKRKDGQADNTPYPWDVLYYEQINNPFDYFECAKYFPLLLTLKGMLDIFADWIGLDIKETHIPVWHPDVKTFEVWDGENEEFCGYLYTDLNPREGKVQASQTFLLQPSFLSRHGERTHASAVLLCSFEKECLQHDEVVMLFHELGHCMHNLLSRTKYARFCGPALDHCLVEVPSQVLERLCWHPNILRRLGRHFETGQTIPDEFCKEIMQKRKSVENFRIVSAAFDRKIHSCKSQEHAESMDPTQLYSEIRCEIEGTQRPESESGWDRDYSIRLSTATMPGTAYLYILGHSYAELIWRLFGNDPFDNKARANFRKLLAKGNGDDPMEILVSLLGKKPKLEDLLDALYG